MIENDLQSYLAEMVKYLILILLIIFGKEG